MMIRFAFALLLMLLLFASNASAQGTYTVFGSRANLAWDPYTQAEITEQGLIRFEVQFDSTLLGPAEGVPAPTPIPTTFYSYVVPPQLVVYGPHQAHVRACNPSRCSDWQSIVVNVEYVPPTVPRNFRVPPTQLNLDQTVEMVHSWSYYNRQVRLSIGELQFLVAYWPGYELTQQNVDRFLRTIAAQ